MDGVLGTGHVLRLFTGETTVRDLQEALERIPCFGVLGEESVIFVDESGDTALHLYFESGTVNDLSLPM